MRKLAMILCLLLLLCGCRKQQQTPANVVFPAQLEEETESILSVISPDTLLFDYKVDESIKSFRLELWKLEETGWESNGAVHGNLSAQQGRLGISYNDGNFAMIEFTDTGSSTSSYTVDGGFTSEQMIGTSKLAQETEIIPEQEIALWVKVGTEKNALSMVLEDFRLLDCESGLAVTVTFSTNVVE